MTEPYSTNEYYKHYRRDTKTEDNIFFWDKMILPDHLFHLTVDVLKWIYATTNITKELNTAISIITITTTTAIAPLNSLLPSDGGGDKISQVDIEQTYLCSKNRSIHINN